MRYLLSLGVTLAWGLWFGGLMTLFLLINAVFKSLGRGDSFDRAGPAMFAYFGLYQLILASLAILLTAIWMLGRRTRGKWMLAILFILAGAAAIVSITCITPKMLEYHQVDPASFRRFHGYSMMLHVAQAVLLLLAGFILPAEILGDGLHGRRGR